MIRPLFTAHLEPGRSSLIKYPEFRSDLPSPKISSLKSRIFPVEKSGFFYKLIKFDQELRKAAWLDRIN